MCRLLLPAVVAALSSGARALTLGWQDADPDLSRESAAVQETCLRAAGLPRCPAGPAWGGGMPQAGCLDSALLAEDMGELGFGAEGCARALQTRSDVRGKPLSSTPEAGQVSPANVSHAKPVVWVHIHKSMGTFIYFMAILNHENVVWPSFNGNWWPYDTPYAVRKGKATHADCSKRSEWFAWSNVTWGQIEHDMDDYNLCHEHFNYGTLLRDPNALAISKASMEMYSPGGITEEHAHNAIERLSKFEVVMFGEDFEDTAHLEAAIGWRPEFFDKAFKRPSTHVVELTDEQSSQARHTNRFDYMVYDHFRRIPIQQRVKKLQ